MFEHCYTESVTLRNPTGVTLDGEIKFAELNCPGRLIEEAETLNRTSSGIVRYDKVFLIRSPVAPLPGCRIIFQKTEYAVGGVRCCRTLDGQIECYRCQIL